MIGPARARGSTAAIAAALALVMGSVACGPRVPPAGRPPSPPHPGSTESGRASWYGPTFHGRDTANGERYNMMGLTAAHRSLPFGTYVRVTNRTNGRRLVVRINDRGPFVHGRIIDLSYTAAKILDLPDRGVARVKLEVLAPDLGARIHRIQSDLVKRKGIATWSDRDFLEIEAAEASARSR